MTREITGLGDAPSLNDRAPVHAPKLTVWNPHAAPDEMSFEGLPWSFSHAPGSYVAGGAPRLPCRPCARTTAGALFTAGAYTPRVLQGNRLEIGQMLLVGMRMFSPNGRAMLLLQSDGNLVLSDTYRNLAIWATMTQNRGVTQAHLQQDGNFVLSDGKGHALWASETRLTPVDLAWGKTNFGNRLQLQDNGDLVAWGLSWKDGRIWTSETPDYRQNTSVLPHTSIFEDILKPFSDAGEWVNHAVRDAVDAIKTVPGIGFIVEQIEDFSKSAVGRIFLAALGPGILSEFFTALPGVGMQIAGALSTLGPVATQMLPGLVRGERVDRVFIDSVKSVVSRAMAAGGGSEVSSQIINPAVQAVTDALKSTGIDPLALVAKADQLRQEAGLSDPTQELPPQFQSILDAQTRPLVEKIKQQIPDLARVKNLPEDALHAALDGVTRTINYKPTDFDAHGKYLDDATRAKLASAVAAIGDAARKKNAELAGKAIAAIAESRRLAAEAAARAQLQRDLAQKAVNAKAQAIADQRHADAVAHDLQVKQALANAEAHDTHAAVTILSAPKLAPFLAAVSHLSLDEWVSHYEHRIG